jgi:hypothetical protein
MREVIVQRIAQKVKDKMSECVLALQETLCFEEMERSVQRLTQEVVREVSQGVLEEVLADPGLLPRLKAAAGVLGYRFVGYRRVHVRILLGVDLGIESPYFVRVGSKRGRKKPGPNGRGCHLLLEVLGFIGRISPLLGEELVQMALLCPSLEVAREILEGRQISVDAKTLRRVCRLWGKRGMTQRSTIALEDGVSVAGRTVCIGIDGGRLRTRKPKRGRKRASQKRKGYETPWREPKVFTIYVLDAQGRVDRSWTPIHEATLGDADAMCALLEATLRALDIQQAIGVVFLGDGAPWIWERVESLKQTLGLSPDQVVEVLDYYHVTSDLWKLVQMQPGLSETQQKTCYAAWKQLLWEGKHSPLRRVVLKALRGNVRKEATSTLDHFQKHQARMAYAQLKARGLPIGSGCVESAIRRIVNLRLKAPGTFWTPEMAECFLLLRSRLISGRWRIFMTNLTRAYRTPEIVSLLFSDSSRQGEETLPLKTGTDDL